MRNALTIFSCIVSLALCFPSAPTGTGNRRAVGLVAEGLNKVTTQILKAARTVHGCNENLLFSPLSISVSIAMLLEGSAGETEMELLRALHLVMTPDDRREGFSELLQSMKGQENEVSHILEIANAIYVQDQVPLKEEFRNILSRKYFALIENKDFQRNADGVLQDINNWVAHKTRNEIPEFLSPGSLSPATVMYLLNAVYFSGTWESQFPVQNTDIQPFYKSETETVDVEMMHAESDYRAAFIEELQANATEIPYEGQRMTMLVIVPTKVDGLKEVERKITSNLIEEILYRKIVHRPVDLSMPKLKLEGELKLKEVMMEMGIRDVFQQSANLSKITPAYETGLYVSSAKHKATLKVDEQGTKAAAVTGIGIVPLSGFWEPPQAMVISADRPFMLFIYDWDARIIIFTGSVSNPNEASIDIPQRETFGVIPQAGVPVHNEEEQKDELPVQEEQASVEGHWESTEQEDELPVQEEQPSVEENWEPSEYGDSTQVDQSREVDRSDQYDQSDDDDFILSKPRNPFNPFTLIAAQRFRQPISQVKDSQSSYDKIVFLGPVYHEYMDV